MKQKRIEDKKLMKELRERPCIVCEYSPCDPHHIKSKGSGGPDLEWNLLTLCHKHHVEIHQLGLRKFGTQNPIVLMVMGSMGWTLLQNGKLFNPKLLDLKRP